MDEKLGNRGGKGGEAERRLMSRPRLNCMELVNLVREEFSK